ncbi:Wee1-like protein kinase [Vairimorpha necatrix]|uniref:Wee1-like protein kinase n=1 Tax=Vairimorpha necatrix TaxID=6039 RepID=A0AAX4JF75_9MICR
MPNKKSFTLKQEVTENIFSTPKTPVKKVVYRDMIDSSILDFNIPSIISSDDYDNLLLIGEGDFYLVYKTNKDTVLKKSKLPIKNSLDYDMYNKEVSILKIIESEYVTRFISSYTYQSHFFIELEYCNGGNLRDYLTSVFYKKKEVISRELLRKIMYDISRGVREIHIKGYVHLDIKPENILLQEKYKSNDKNSINQDSMIHNSKDDKDSIHKDSINQDSKHKDNIHIIHKDSIHKDSIHKDNIHIIHKDNINDYIFKIGDLGISTKENEDIKLDGDKRYMAPEILRNICTPSSDIFSLGLIYLEILRGINLPKKGEAWLKLRRNNFRGIKMDQISKKMLQMDYKKRPDIHEVVNYFK